ncbi:MAG: hypothetical protein SH817_13565 [Leptospira sp.]|nr:hypothetical protein [Leptospira sp.]
MKDFQFYAVNFFGGEDTQIPAKLYHEVFSWEIQGLSIGHSELMINESLRLIFSKRSEKCPVTPGTLTLVTDRFWLDEIEQFVLEQSIDKNQKYKSYIDPWKNRIWLYSKPSLSNLSIIDID